jgi:threonine aldolase
MPADFRSDTVTLPTPAMAAAMAAACTAGADAVGDDVYGEDATIRALEARVAALLGKEAAVFVPTCTMANLLAVGAHCGRGDEVLLGSESHIFVYEQGGASWLMGAPFHAVPNAPDGTLPLAAVRAALATRAAAATDAHYARPGLVAIENTANRCGGAALPVAYMDELAALAAAHGLPLHCDGARLLNAAAALGVAPARLVAGCATVSLCLSKGLGAPLGALLAGGAAAVARARRLRKAVGGGMRQAGVVAAAGLVALDRAAALGEDHARARALAAALGAVRGLAPQARVDTNIVYVALDAALLGAAAWDARVAAARAAGAAAVVDAESGAAVPLDAAPAGAADAAVFVALLRAAAGVKAGSYGTAKMRFVTHGDVGDDAVADAARGAAIAARLMGVEAGGGGATMFRGRGPDKHALVARYSRKGPTKPCHFSALVAHARGLARPRSGKKTPALSSATRAAMAATMSGRAAARLLCSVGSAKTLKRHVGAAAVPQLNAVLCHGARAVVSFG